MPVTIIFAGFRRSSPPPLFATNRYVHQYPPIAILLETIFQHQHDHPGKLFQRKRRIERDFRHLWQLLIVEITILEEREEEMFFTVRGKAGRKNVE